MVRVHPAWPLSRRLILAAARRPPRVAAASTPYPDSGTPVMSTSASFSLTDC